MEQVANTMNSTSQADSLSEQMKSIRKAKLQREVYADPGMARQLVATEASPVYNASGEISAAVSTMQISV